jgi:hypothetical protein
MRRWLPHRILGGKHVTNPRQTSVDESESDTWTSQGSKGPPETQTDSKLAMHLELTLGPTYISVTGRMHSSNGGTRGSAQRPLATLILAFHVVPSNWLRSAPRGVLDTFGARGLHVLFRQIEGRGLICTHHI